MGKEEMHVVSLSGGKDSTAMLLMMLEKNMRVDEIVFCDTGVEFPEMYEHLDKVEKYIGMPITRIKADHDFEYYLYEYVRKKGRFKGEKGYGWARAMWRWCTEALKVQPFNRYMRTLGDYDVIRYIGIAYDERERVGEFEYPLVDWKITESEALQYCYDKGFDWGGAYEKFKRFSCYLCPIQPLDSLRTLRKEYPELWSKMMVIDKKTPNTFKIEYSLNDLERKFDLEDRGLIKKGERKAVFMTDEELIERKDQRKP